MTVRVTISLDDATHEAAQAAASAAGMSISGYIGTAVRRQVLRDSMAAERRWLGQHPDVAAAADADARADEADRAAAADADDQALRQRAA
ncbi:MAG: hypothetical protein IRZ05_15575 [Micromonosporaceae bacterium]|jgi:uncharacterized membrane protein YccC|nr:hypothetical protein [Micromonosporaceae bacterium]